MTSKIKFLVNAMLSMTEWSDANVSSMHIVVGKNILRENIFQESF